MIQKYINKEEVLENYEVSYRTHKRSRIPSRDQDLLLIIKKNKRFAPRSVYENNLLRELIT